MNSIDTIFEEIVNNEELIEDDNASLIIITSI